MQRLKRLAPEDDIDMALNDEPDAEEIIRRARQSKQGTSTLARIARYALVRVPS